MKPRLAIVFCLLLATPSFAQTYLGSCPIFPPENPWNQRVDTLPVHPNSAIYISHVGGATHLHPDFGSNQLYGIPWIGVNGSQPMVPITWATDGYGQSDPGPMPIPPNAKIEQPSDSHVLVVDTTNKKLYELYQGKKDQSGSGWSCTCSAIFDLAANKYRPDSWTSADAAGLPIFPGLVRKYECDAGEIKHAIRFTVQKSSRGWIFPARHHAGSTNDTTFMPMGLRLRLKASFDDSKYTGNAKVIATAMKKYGIIMADNGSNWFITGENNTNWDDNNIGQLKSITGNDFEVVYSGPIATDSGQYPIPIFSSKALTMTPSTLSFGSVKTGTTAMDTLTVTNSSNTAINVSNAMFAPPISQFYVISKPNSVPAYGTAKVIVGFVPDKVQTFAGTLAIVTDESGGSNYTVTVTGNGIVGAVGILSGSPALIDFGSVDTGAALTKDAWLFNTGTAALTLNSYGVVGSSAFSVPNFFTQISIPAKDSFKMEITFSPHALGPDTATFTAEATDNPDVRIKLRGNGVIPQHGAVSSVLTDGTSLKILPNPVAGSATVSFSLTTSSRVSLSLTDALGREIRHLSDGAHSSGNHALSFSVADLPNGTYFLRMTTDSGTTTKTIEVLH